jgi:heme-degrading monooxygenase HmoA
LSLKGRYILMSNDQKAWKTQEEAKHATHHHMESPFGGGVAASRKEMEAHRISDSLSAKAHRDLVQAKMAALAKSIIDTEREYFIKTLWQLNLTQEERVDLMKQLREQGIVHLLPGPGEEYGESRKGRATYMAIRKYHIIPGTGEEFLQRVQTGFVPIISRIPGFIAYDALQVGNDQIVSISVFDTPLGVIESTPRALQWVQENIAGLIQEMPEVMVGQVGASSVLDRIYGKARRKLFRTP